MLHINGRGSHFAICFEHHGVQGERETDSVSALGVLNRECFNKIMATSATPIFHVSNVPATLRSYQTGNRLGAGRMRHAG